MTVTEMTMAPPRMDVWKLRLWFDGVPLVELPPLLDGIAALGWRASECRAGEWVVTFRRVCDSDEEFFSGLARVKELFSTSWSDAQYERPHVYRQTP